MRTSTDGANDSHWVSFLGVSEAGGGQSGSYEVSVGGFDLDGGAHAAFAVGALVVPPLHVLQGGELDLFDGLPRSVAADEFGLVQAVHGFGQRIVIAVADTAGRGCGAEFGDAFGVDKGEVVRPVVGSPDTPISCANRPSRVGKAALTG